MSKYDEAISVMREYVDDDEGFVVLEHATIQTIFEALRAAQARDNPVPLTLAELRERDGMPVFVVPKKCPERRGWFLVECPPGQEIQFLDICRLSTMREWTFGYYDFYDYPPKEVTP
jgi:hypothetical protein